MKALAIVAFGVFLVIFALYAWLGGTSVRTGWVGVRVNQIGSNAGVVDQELGVGWYFPQWGSDVMRFPTTSRTEVWSDAPPASSGFGDQSNAPQLIGPAIQFNNADGVPTRIAISMQVHVDPTRASDAVQKYRLGFQEMISGPVQRDLQDAFVRHGIRYTSDALIRQGAGNLLAEVTQTIRARLAEDGIVVDNINLVGSPALPESIMARINERIEAEQNAATQQQQVQVVEAQARQAVAAAQGEAQAAIEAARGRATAMDLEGEALRRNPNVVQLRMLERWNGLCPPDVDICAPGASVLAESGSR